MTALDPLAVKCPYCGAAVLRQCVKREKPHAVRIRAAVRPRPQRRVRGWAAEKKEENRG